MDKIKFWSKGMIHYSALFQGHWLVNIAHVTYGTKITPSVLKVRYRYNDVSLNSFHIQMI